LTGSRIPDQLLIQIMTISGKIVRTIDLADFGLMRIGRNISDFAWDGRDEYGDKLANGVYLYRVQVKMDGQDIEHRDTKVDPYFKKGFGKMVILR
jgi:flagellar hook assembly protein FlgD